MCYFRALIDVFFVFFLLLLLILIITQYHFCVQRKCDMYWPKDGMETYGIVQVRLLQEVVMATYTLRTFHVKNLKIKKVCVSFIRFFKRFTAI